MNEMPSFYNPDTKKLSEINNAFSNLGYSAIFLNPSNGPDSDCGDDSKIKYNGVPFSSERLHLENGESIIVTYISVGSEESSDFTQDITDFYKKLPPEVIGSRFRDNNPDATVTDNELAIITNHKKVNLSSIVAVNERTGKIIAHATAGKLNKSSSRLVDVGVVADPEYKRLGLGAKILEQLLFAAKCEGAEYAIISTTDKNKPMKNLMIKFVKKQDPLHPVFTTVPSEPGHDPQSPTIYICLNDISADSNHRSEEKGNIDTFLNSAVKEIVSTVTGSSKTTKKPTKYGYSLLKDYLRLRIHSDFTYDTSYKQARERLARILIEDNPQYSALHNTINPKKKRKKRKKAN